MTSAPKTLTGFLQKNFLILTIAAVGFALRFWAVDFGLPDLYHADEPIVVNHALAYGSWDFNPHFFRIPPLTSYLLFLCYGIYFLVGKGTGYFSGVQEFERLFYDDPGSFYLIARIIFGVLAGTVTLILLYQIVKKHFSDGAAILAAFFLSVCFLHVRDSHFIYADIPLILVMVAAFGVFFAAAGRQQSRYHVISGIFIGAAVAVKYNGGVLIFPYLVVSAASGFNLRLIRFWIFAGAASLLTYFCLNPFSLLDWEFFVREIRAESLVHPGMAFAVMLTQMLPNAIGAPLLALAILGMIRAVIKPDAKRISMLIFILGYGAVICLYGQPYERYVLPLLPFLLLFAADFTVEVLRRRILKHSILTAAAAVLCAVPTFSQSVLFNQVMSAKDTRTLAKEWVEEHIPPGAAIALDHSFYMPRLKMSRRQLAEKKAAFDQFSPLSAAKQRRFDYYQEHSPGPAYDLYLLTPEGAEKDKGFLFAPPGLPYDTRVLRDKGVEYLILTVLMESEEGSGEFYRRLDQEWEWIAEFNPYRGRGQLKPLMQPLTNGPFFWKDLSLRERNGFAIRIYKLK